MGRLKTILSSRPARLLLLCWRTAYPLLVYMLAGYLALYGGLYACAIRYGFFSGERENALARAYGTVSSNLLLVTSLAALLALPLLLFFLRRDRRRAEPNRVRFEGDLVINYSDRSVRQGDREIPLVKKEFDILSFLSQHPGLVFDKERIYEQVWDYDSEGDSAVVAEHIRRIRTKLAAAGAEPFIETVWGCGYRWKK